MARDGSFVIMDLETMEVLRKVKKINKPISKHHIRAFVMRSNQMLKFLRCITFRDARFSPKSNVPVSLLNCNFVSGVLPVSGLDLVVFGTGFPIMRRLFGFSRSVLHALYRPLCMSCLICYFFLHAAHLSCPAFEQHIELC